MRAVSRRESDAILGAVRQVALADGGPITHADTASIAAAARYLLRRADVGSLPAAEPADLVAALEDKDVAREAVKYLAIMSLVDGALDIEEAYLTEIVEAASGHMAWVIADMTMRNAEASSARHGATGPILPNGSCPTPATRPIAR